MKCERSMRDRKSYREARSRLRQIAPPAPSADLWNRIEATIEERAVRSRIPRVFPIPIVRLRYVAATVAIVLALVYGTLTVQQETAMYAQANAHLSDMLTYMQKGTQLAEDSFDFLETF